jgi:hypothetical protein
VLACGIFFVLAEPLAGIAPWKVLLVRIFFISLMLFCLFYFVGRMENPFSNGRIYLCHLPSPYKRDADCAWIDLSSFFIAFCIWIGIGLYYKDTLKRRRSNKK